jgi:hypothetical protein
MASTPADLDDENVIRLMRRKNLQSASTACSQRQPWNRDDEAQCVKQRIARPNLAI